MKAPIVRAAVLENEPTPPDQSCLKLQECIWVHKPQSSYLIQSTMSGLKFHAYHVIYFQLSTLPSQELFISWTCALLEGLSKLFRSFLWFCCCLFRNIFCLVANFLLWNTGLVVYVRMEHTCRSIQSSRSKDCSSIHLMSWKWFPPL